MAQWQVAMVKSPEVDSPESWTVPEQQLAMATDELVKVKLPDEVPSTLPGLVDCVTAGFAQLCDDFGGGHAVPQPLLPGQSCASTVRRLAQRSVGV